MEVVGSGEWIWGDRWRGVGGGWGRGGENSRG